MSNEYKANEKSKLEIGMYLWKVIKKDTLDRFYWIDLVNYQIIGKSQDPKCKEGEKKCKIFFLI